MAFERFSVHLLLEVDIPHSQPRHLVLSYNLSFPSIPLSNQKLSSSYPPPIPESLAVHLDLFSGHKQTIAVRESFT